jgi:hypothetical protein
MEGQNELRALLRSGIEEPELLDRIIRLLNPWDADLVQLSDNELAKNYFIVNQQNNYWPLPDRGPLASEVVFDASHGYYVGPVVRPLL